MDLVQLVSSLNTVFGDLAINSGPATLVQALTEEVQTQARNLEKLGMLNDQGAESIHALFNTLQRTYGSMQNKVERLKCTVKEHFRQIWPDNLSRMPSTKRRKQSAEE